MQTARVSTDLKIFKSKNVSNLPIIMRCHWGSNHDIRTASQVAGDYNAGKEHILPYSNIVNYRR